MYHTSLHLLLSESSLSNHFTSTSPPAASVVMVVEAMTVQSHGFWDVFSTVGGLSPSSIHAACEKLLLCQRQDEDGVSDSSSQIPVTRSKSSSASPSPPLWVSPWRTLAVNEDSNLSEHDSSDQHSEAETDSVPGEWDFYPDPRQEEDKSAAGWDTGSESDMDIYMGEEEFMQDRCQKTDQDYEGDCEEERANEEEEEWDSTGSVEQLSALRDLFPLLQKGHKRLWGSEEELEYLRDGESQTQKHQLNKACRHILQYKNSLEKP